MAWDFKTDPEFQEKLDWMETFVRDEIFPLEVLGDVWRTPEGRYVNRRLGKVRERSSQEGISATVAGVIGNEPHAVTGHTDGAGGSGAARWTRVADARR